MGVDPQLSQIAMAIGVISLKPSFDNFIAVSVSAFYHKAGSVNRHYMARAIFLPSS